MPINTVSCQKHRMFYGNEKRQSMTSNNIEYLPDNETSGDRVVCLNCEWSGVVKRGREDCPNCHTTGTLAWVNKEAEEYIT